MPIVIATISILVITGTVWLFSRITGFGVCPICAGVSLTWFWMLIGMLTGQLSVVSYQLPVAILMGGSVVGIAYQLEKRLPVFAKATEGKPANQSALLWKVLFIPFGFATVYSAVKFYWLGFVLGLAWLGIAAFIFLRRPKVLSREDSSKVKELEDKMESCC